MADEMAKSKPKPVGERPGPKLARGILVVFEGIDGCGKSVQAKRLARRLRAQGLEVVRSKEPTDGRFKELFREWFRALAHNAGITLHVETHYGDNAHHIAESCFKGLARALRRAIEIDPREMNAVPSTKGTL